MSSPDLVFQLSGTCNNYEWGKSGWDSLAAVLCEKTPHGFEIEDGKPYSEMWFGDYPDFPARVLKTGEPLQDYIEKNKKALLGVKVINELGGQLPYLPKILSIKKALPLQIHPHKELASKLHQEDPKTFTDPNHKPEIAIALSKFEVFAGWKPLDQIVSVFKFRPLHRFIPGGFASTWADETLRQVTRNILSASEETIKNAQDALSTAYKKDLGDSWYILGLLPRLQAQYGRRDPGNLVALLCMNYMVLSPGEALYIPEDGIHAYLSGDIVECMARSNNVLNTGFCPAADRDSVELFSKTLTFTAHSKKDVALPKESSKRGRNGRTSEYKPPLSEFDMLSIELDEGEEESLTAAEGPSVAIVTSGEGTLEGDGNQFDIKTGFIFYIAPGVGTGWKGTVGNLQVYMAVV